MNSKIRLLSVVCLWSVSACAHGSMLGAQARSTESAQAASGASSEQQVASPTTTLAAPAKVLLPENLRNLTYLDAYTSREAQANEGKVVAAAGPHKDR